MENQHLKHSLSTRHILMIALGSAIGTGFFFGTGASIKLTGPAILLSYAIGGILMYIIVRALGEMAVSEPSSGSFSYYAYKYIGNYAGFISGWNYWFNYIIVCMLELTATSIFLDYWFPHTIHWLITLGVMGLFMLINLLHVRWFGEFEFWFAGIKVSTVIILILFGLYILLLNPAGHSASLRNLWQYGGFFAHGLSGFLFSFVVVVFSFGGSELVGITAGETANPGRSIPLAINGTILRIMLFYIATLGIVICLYPWNKINTNFSPFVDVFQQMGIPRAASLMNLVAISAALSSLNSGIYGTGRMLYNLSQQGNAPSFLGKVNHKGVPVSAVMFSMLCIAISVLLNYLFPKQIFSVLLAIATLAAIINWLTILVTHSFFRRKFQGNRPYQLCYYPLSSIIAIFFLLLVASIMYFMPEMHLAIVIAPLWIILLSLGYLFKSKLTEEAAL